MNSRNTGIRDKIAALLRSQRNLEEEKESYVLSQLLDEELSPRAAARLERKLARDEISPRAVEAWQRYERIRQVVQQRDRRTENALGPEFTRSVMSSIEGLEAEGRGYGSGSQSWLGGLMTPALAAAAGAVVCFVGVMATLEFSGDDAGVLRLRGASAVTADSAVHAIYGNGLGYETVEEAAGAPPRAGPAAVSREEMERYLNRHLAWGGSGDAASFYGDELPPQQPIPLLEVSGEEGLPDRDRK